MREPVFEGHSSVWAGTNHVPSPVPPGRSGAKGPVDRTKPGIWEEAAVPPCPDPSGHRPSG